MYMYMCVVINYKSGGNGNPQRKNQGLAVIQTQYLLHVDVLLVLAYTFSSFYCSSCEELAGVICLVWTYM